MYKGCKFDLTYRGAMATIPSGRHRAGNVIRWNTFLKHDPPFDWTCTGFSATRTSAKSGCHLYQFQVRPSETRFNLISIRKLLCLRLLHVFSCSPFLGRV
jgi:hypothetical protein